MEMNLYILDVQVKKLSSPPQILCGGLLVNRS